MTGTSALSAGISLPTTPPPAYAHGLETAADLVGGEPQGDDRDRHSEQPRDSILHLAPPCCALMKSNRSAIVESADPQASRRPLVAQVPIPVEPPIPGIPTPPAPPVVPPDDPRVPDVHREPSIDPPSDEPPIGSPSEPPPGNMPEPVRLRDRARG